VHSKLMISGWLDRVILAGALVMFFLTEAVVIVALLGWPNGHASLGSRGIRQLLVNAFLISIPFVAGIRGSSVVKDLRSRFGAEGEAATFVWLWRQYLAGTICAYAAIIVIVISLTEAFRGWHSF
jgi:hypothetical protein